MKPDGRATNGGARRRTGPVVRRVQLDTDVADLLRALATERRQLTPDMSESELTKRIVSDLIRAAWSESDAAFAAAADTGERYIAPDCPLDKRTR